MKSKKKGLRCVKGAIAFFKFSKRGNLKKSLENPEIDYFLNITKCTVHKMK